jgi:hypothetical protein
VFEEIYNYGLLNIDRGKMNVILDYDRSKDKRICTRAAFIRAVGAIVTPFLALAIGRMLPRTPHMPPMNIIGVTHGAVATIPTLAAFVICLWTMAQMWTVRVGWLAWFVISMGLLINAFVFLSVAVVLVNVLLAR